MTDEGSLSLPNKKAQGRLLALGGKSISAIVSHLSGVGLAGDLLEILVDYFSDLVREKRNVRAREFCERLERVKGDAKKVLESPESSEPLVGVFLSSLKECLEDDEDGKVRYYAALMAGVADPSGSPLTQHQRMAMLQAMKNLRVHDLYVMALLASTRDTSHATAASVEELKKHEHPPEHGLIDWDLLPVGLTTLMSYGLVEDDPRQVNAAVPQPNRYKLTKLGKTMWKKIKPHLDPSQSAC